MQFLQSSTGEMSGSRIFALIIIAATIGDWMYAIFFTPAGIWKPTLDQVGMVLGVLGYKVAGKSKEKN